MKPQILREGVRCDDFFLAESSRKVSVEDIADAEHQEELVFHGEVKWMDRPSSDDGYDGPVLLGVVGDGGIGHHVYSAGGPAVTQKTWGEGPGESTGLYLFKDGTIRRLSPWEAMRAHSFPESLLMKVRELGLEQAELYRLVGNSIPVSALKAIISHIMTLVDSSQIPAV